MSSQIEQINQELRQRLPRKPAIHDRTVARTLEGERNRPDVLQKRVDYANWFMRHAVVNHSIFVDECGYNIWTARSHGRARMRERAYRQVCGQRGRNVTVALAISPTNGLVFHSAFLGGMTGQRFNDFLTQARLNLDPNEHLIFIYDGAPAHNNPAIPGPNSELKKLPPYSPFHNIVEQAISALKAAITADIRRLEQHEIMNNRAEARRQGIALGNFRTQYFRPCRKTLALSRLLNVDSGTDLCKRTCIPRCLNNEEIEG
ncbi:uncharacterized protein [Montipora foliosa]|uniref:uncharacterized protein n=1 Tax=Montipora foliosa TaxID=591990 RepID=UPI0035F1D0B0